MPRSFATCAIGRPVVRTSRTARSRSSSGYLRGAGTARGSPSGQDHKPGFRDSTKPGAAQPGARLHSGRAGSTIQCRPERGHSLRTGGPMLKQVAEGVLIHRSELLENNTVVVQGRDGVLLVDAGITGAEMTCLANDL